MRSIVENFPFTPVKQCIKHDFSLDLYIYTVPFPHKKKAKCGQNRLFHSVFLHFVDNFFGFYTK